MSEIRQSEVAPPEVMRTALRLAAGFNPWPDGPQNEMEWDLCAAAWREVARRRRDEIVRLRGLLRDVADSGVSFEDSRIAWVEVQIDRDTWDAIQ